MKIKCMLQVYRLANNSTEDRTHSRSHVFADGRPEIVGGGHWDDSALRFGDELVTVCELEYCRPIKLCEQEVSALEANF